MDALVRLTYLHFLQYALIFLNETIHAFGAQLDISRNHTDFLNNKTLFVSLFLEII